MSLRELPVDPQSGFVIPTATPVVAGDLFSKHPSAITDCVLDPIDRTVLHDSKHRPITVDRWLHSKPLKHDISSRPGPHGKKLHYLSGDSVTRTLNQVFGYDGWNLSIIKTDQVVCDQQRSSNDKSAQGHGKWHVAYLAQVRITHVRSGSFREDIGAGDSVDKSLATAVQHALKGSITDAMKRAARHFGDKLGNSLYSTDFKYNEAPATATQALEQYDKDYTRHYGSLSSKDFSSLKPVLTPSSSYHDTNSTIAIAWNEMQDAIKKNASHLAKSAPVACMATHDLPDNIPSIASGKATNYATGNVTATGAKTAPPTHSSVEVIISSTLPANHGVQDLYGNLDDSFWPSDSPPSCMGRSVKNNAVTEQIAGQASKKQKVNPYSL
jgi:DNA recombination protein Rad52